MIRKSAADESLSLAAVKRYCEHVLVVEDDDMLRDYLVGQS